jgi:predicted proteasome-type protease
MCFAQIGEHIYGKALLDCAQKLYVAYDIQGV